MSSAIIKIRRQALLLAILWALFAAVRAEAGSADSFLWLQCGERLTHADGSVTQLVYLRDGWSEAAVSGIDDLRAVYCSGRSSGDKQYYELPVQEQEDGSVLRLHTPTDFSYQLTVTGRRGQEELRAQLAVTVYAYGFKAAANQATAEPPAALPNFIMPYTSRLQTGRTLNFSYAAAEKHSSYSVAVLDSASRQVSLLTADAKGKFSYTPEHDRELNCKDYTQNKSLLLCAEEKTPDGKVYRSITTILLRRPSNAFTNVAHGLALFAAVLAAGVLTVVIRRRRMKRCW